MARPVRAALAAQPVSPPIHVRSLNHFAIAVSDPKRTIDFYQGLFGMPVQARTGTTTVLRWARVRSFSPSDRSQPARRRASPITVWALRTYG